MDIMRISCKMFNLKVIYHKHAIKNHRGYNKLSHTVQQPLIQKTCVLIPFSWKNFEAKMQMTSLLFRKQWSYQMSLSLIFLSVLPQVARMKHVNLFVIYLLIDQKFLEISNNNKIYANLEFVGMLMRDLFRIKQFSEYINSDLNSFII